MAGSLVLLPGVVDSACLLYRLIVSGFVGFGVFWDYDCFRGFRVGNQGLGFCRIGFGCLLGMVLFLGVCLHAVCVVVEVDIIEDALLEWVVECC